MQFQTKKKTLFFLAWQAERWTSQEKRQAFIIISCFQRDRPAHKSSSRLQFYTTDHNKFELLCKNWFFPLLVHSTVLSWKQLEVNQLQSYADSEVMLKTLQNAWIVLEFPHIHNGNFPTMVVIHYLVPATCPRKSCLQGSFGANELNFQKDISPYSQLRDYYLCTWYHLNHIFVVRQRFIWMGKWHCYYPFNFRS